MRRYDHRPDEAFIAKKLAWERDDVDGALARLASGTADGFYLGVAATELLHTVQCAWALEEPVPWIRSVLDRVAAAIDDGVARGVELSPTTFETWFLVVIVSGRSAERLAAAVLRDPAAVAGESAVAREFLVALAQLVVDDAVAAGAAAERMTQVLRDPAAAPLAAEAYAVLDELVAAAAARDAARVDTAVAARTAATTAQYKRNAQSRRNAHGLLDVRAVAILRAAGVRVPAGANATMGAELVEAAG